MRKLRGPLCSPFHVTCPTAIYLKRCPFHAHSRAVHGRAAPQMSCHASGIAPDRTCMRVCHCNGEGTWARTWRSESMTSCSVASLLAAKRSSTER